MPEGWLKTYERATGRLRMVGIPSKSKPGKYHLVTTAGCDCTGFAFSRKPKTCSHYRALLLVLDSTPAQPLPACPTCQGQHANDAEAAAHHAARAAEAASIWGTDE
jgi:hypothetical protein